jgi:hypothetical protein
MIFHWPLSELEVLDIDRLLFWREKAVAAWNRVNKPDSAP